MSQRPIPVLALVATGALTLSGVNSPTFAATTAPGDVLPAAPASSPKDQPGTQVEDVLLSMRQADAGGLTLPDASNTRESADDTPTTIIVQLEEGDAGVPWHRRVFGLASSTKHDEVKARISSAVAGVVPGAQTTTVRDYSHALDGFAIEAPGSALAAIQATDGVKAAFIERVRATMDTSADGAGNPTLKNASSLAMTRANEATQKGDRQVIEVIDSGLQLDHDAFSGSMDGVDVRMTASDVAAFTSKLAHGKTGTYVNSKIPFVYDYADNDADVVPHSAKDLSHGTHVTAIAAANGDVLQGTAPHAQIVVAKVTSDANGSLTDSAILAALDDALVIKPDVINLSLGDDAGMSSEAGTIFADVYKALADAGITVNAAAGNAFSNAYGNNSGQNKPFATDPDTGTLGEPASYKSTLAVASIDNQEALPYVELGDRRIAYRNALDDRGENVPGLRDIVDKNYRVVFAGAGGSEELEHLTGSDLSDAIILENKGGTDARSGQAMTDELKASHLAALSHAPAALMIADTDEAETPYQALLGSTRTIPTVTISKMDAEAIIEAIADTDGADVFVRVTHSGVVLASKNPTASEFSSWGVAPDLTLKPEIAAPGGDILSAVLGNDYQRLSGTSMASPQVAGISALVRQRIATDPLFAGKSDADKSALVTNFLMGTARPLIDVELGDGSYYSPRKVGAGAVDALAATTASVYPTVIGAADPSRPKADLGDGTTGWTFQVQLSNLSDTAHTYTLGGQALSELAQEGILLEHSRNWAGEGISLAFSGDAVVEAGDAQQISVPARSSATVTVTVTPEADFITAAEENTPKGTFIDGAVTFASVDETPSLTVPYLGFYGSWGTPNVFDGKWSDNETTPVHVYRSALVNAHSSIPLGSLNPLSDKQDVNLVGKIDPDRFIASRAGLANAPDEIVPLTGMLRSVPSVRLTYRNSAGQTVNSYTINRVRKSLYDLATGWTKPGEFSGEEPVFDGYDESGQALPDGRYTLTLEAATDGPSSQTHQMSYEFTLDTKAPVISNVTVHGEGEERTISFDVADDSPLAGIDVHESAGGAWYFRKLIEDDGEIQADGTHLYHCEVSVAELNRAWKEMGRTGEAPATSYLFAWDWGLNPAQQEVSLHSDPSPAPGPAPAPQAGEWKWNGVGWWYRYNDGTYPSNGVAVIDEGTYRFDEHGYMRTGWVWESESWYYHVSSGKQASGWVKDGMTWYYLDPTTGVMATGWVKDGASWYYLMPGSGAMATGWLDDGGSWYYLSTASGAMVTGWLKDGGRWYYLTPGNGAMATGWLKDGDHWYYLTPGNGAMATGWQWIGWQWYRFADNGQWIG